MLKKRHYLYLDEIEYRVLIRSLVQMKNRLIHEGRFTDCVDELILKALKADSERKLSEKDETIAAQANTIKDSSEENALLRDELIKYHLKEAEALSKKNRWRNILRFIWSIVWKLGVLVGITALAIYLESKCNSKIPMYISMGVNAVGVIYTLWSALKKDKEKYLKKDSGKSTSA